jgi:hypothetical protein
MVMKQLSVIIAICIGLGMAHSDFRTFAAAPASVTKIDFDAVFADARQGGLNAGYVNRARKSDRLTSFRSVLPEPALLPYCEPVASPFADPILGRIAGRCDA